jgi:hypothetical protein
MEITAPVIFEVLATHSTGPLDTDSNRRPFPRVGSSGPASSRREPGLVIPERTREVLGASLTILAIAIALVI